MEIRNIRHKGLKALVEKGSAKGLPATYVSKITDILEYLIAIEAIDEIYALPKYKPHLLTGDRVGTYSLSVTPNWRITFKHEDGELYDMDYEDYH